MAVVGEMHVGKGREEKEKRKRKEREGEVKARISRATLRLSHSRCARREHLACDRRCVAREMRMPLARVVLRLTEGSQARASCTQAGT